MLEILQNSRIRLLALIAGILFIVLGILIISQVIMVEKAHSTFANYYAFRGCSQLLQKTDTYAICKNDQGQTIKMVLYKGKWYLDGDLPTCIGSMCI